MTEVEIYCPGFDLRCILEALRIGGPRGLATGFRPQEQREFHTLRRLRPGHWKYMGHLITRDYDGYAWRIHGYSEPTNPFGTKDAARWRLFNEYTSLVRESYKIEIERRKCGRH